MRYCNPSVVHVHKKVGSDAQVEREDDDNDDNSL